MRILTHTRQLLEIQKIFTKSTWRLADQLAFKYFWWIFHLSCSWLWTSSSMPLRLSRSSAPFGWRGGRAGEITFFQWKHSLISHVLCCCTSSFSTNVNTLKIAHFGSGSISLDISLEGNVVEPHAEPALECDKCGDIWDDPKLASGTLAKELKRSQREKMHNPDLTRWLANCQRHRGAQCEGDGNGPVQTCPKKLCPLMSWEGCVFWKAGSLCKFVQENSYKAPREASMWKIKEPNKIFQRLFSGFIRGGHLYRQIQWPSEVPHGCV